MAAARRSRVLVWLPRAVPPPAAAAARAAGNWRVAARVPAADPAPREGSCSCLVHGWLPLWLVCCCCRGLLGLEDACQGAEVGVGAMQARCAERAAGYVLPGGGEPGSGGCGLGEPGGGTALAGVGCAGVAAVRTIRGRSGPGRGAGLRGPQDVRHGVRGGQLGGHGGNGAMLGPMPMPNRGSLGSQCPSPMGGRPMVDYGAYSKPTSK